MMTIMMIIIVMMMIHDDDTDIGFDIVTNTDTDSLD